MKRNNIRYASSDIDAWFQWNLDLKTRTIYLSTINFDSESKEAGVDSLMAEYAIKSLHILGRSQKPIRVIMNNIGGDWFHGMAIYDAIRDCSAPVDIEVLGHAMSMGAVILQAGRKRMIHSNAALMVHDGSTASAGEMPYQSARNWSNFEEKLRSRMYTIFAERSGRYPSYWKLKCSHDTIMTPEQAVEQGLADIIIYPKRNLPNLPKQKRKR